MLYRSKERIQEFGEVFTPEYLVEDMLDLLCKDRKNLWQDVNITFFEPTCGTGNMVVPIYNRRLEALKSLGIFEAITTTISTLWAIDIYLDNIETCRLRVLEATYKFIENNCNIKISSNFIQTHQDFFLQFICALFWHIHQNELLTALSCPQTAQRHANKTKVSKKWYEEKGHYPLNFEMPWLDYFKLSLEKNQEMPELQEAQLFLESLKFDA